MAVGHRQEARKREHIDTVVRSVDADLQLLEHLAARHVFSVQPIFGDHFAYAANKRIGKRLQYLWAQDDIIGKIYVNENAGRYAALNAAFGNELEMNGATIEDFEEYLFEEGRMER